MRIEQLDDVEVVAEGLSFPEGPVVLADGAVLVVEMLAGQVSRVEPDGSVQVIAVVGGGPNGAAIGPDGALYVCNNGGAFVTGSNVAGVQRVDLGTGETTMLYTESGGRPLRAPNDIVFDEQGGFWFTDFGAGAIHYATADGSSITPVIRRVHEPNGVGISPDGSILYWAQTNTRQVMRRRIDAPGSIEPSPGVSMVAMFTTGDVDWWSLLVGMPGAAELDSLAVDSAGAVCVGTLVEPGITEVPADATGLGDCTRWVLPDWMADERSITNIAFGGPDLSTAFLTCSLTGRLVRCRWHRPGAPLAFAA